MVIVDEGEVPGVTVVQEFTEVFRAEHRQLRNLPLELAGAFGDRDAGHARALIAAVAEAAGGAIRNARELQRLAGHGELTEEQAGRGTELTRRILPHVGDCDGLTIMAEALPGDAADRILPAGKAAQKANLDWLSWAATARERRA